MLFNLYDFKLIETLPGAQNLRLSCSIIHNQINILPCSSLTIGDVEEIKDMVQKKRINIQGVKKILSTTHCWEIKRCREEEKKVCPVYIRNRRHIDP